ncbi:hypothetical protein ACOMHN_050098 [Nucella lapillus]
MQDCQGYYNFLLWLTLAWLWALGDGGSPESSPLIQPSSTTAIAWRTQRRTTTPLTAPPTIIAPLPTTSVQAPAGDHSANVPQGISPTSVSSLWTDLTPPSDTSVIVVVVVSSSSASDGDSSFSSQTNALVSESGRIQSSRFVPAGVSVHSTPLTSLGSDEFGVGSSFETEGWERGSTPVLVDSSSSVSLTVVDSTVFVESVAASLRRDPTGVYESSALDSHAPPSPTTRVDFASGATAALPDSGGSTRVLVAPTTSAAESRTPAEHSVFQTLGGKTNVTSSASLPEASSPTAGMLDMNSTQSSSIFRPSGETTSSTFFNSTTTEVSSPGSPSGGNGSCTERDSGCVEYRGEEDEEEEERRIKIIVGAVCGTVLLVVILGVFIYCMVRRRGKMPSGSKIDLSSYWDDSVTLSYINGHVDIPKDSADEMISLDNDSFLNSLDSMSFTNTWTSDTSKHTNF